MSDWTEKTGESLVLLSRRVAKVQEGLEFGAALADLAILGREVQSFWKQMMRRRYSALSFFDRRVLLPLFQKNEKRECERGGGWD